MGLPAIRSLRLIHCLNQIALPNIIPAKAAVSPSKTLAPRLTAALDISPFSNNWIVATLNVENVVYDARKPTVRNILISAGQAGCDESKPTSKPRRNVPLIFAIKVPTRDESICVTITWSTACRATAPSAPPRPINSTYDTLHLKRLTDSDQFLPQSTPHMRDFDGSIA